MKFGDKIRLLRQDAQLTQPELAEKLAVEQSWLSKIENNKSLPSSDLLNQILEIFGISLLELLEGLDSTHKHDQLTSLPEIKRALDTESSRTIRSRERWIVLSATACGIGAVLIFAAFTNLFFPSTAQHYVSEGIIYAGEPLELYQWGGGTFESLNLWARYREEFESQYKGDALSSELKRFHSATRAKFVQDLIDRRSLAEFVSYRDERDSIIMPAEVPPGAIDIFGNVATNGQRIYRLRDRLTPNPLNSIIWVAGCIFLVGGLIGFFIDYRLSILRR